MGFLWIFLFSKIFFFVNLNANQDERYGLAYNCQLFFLMQSNEFASQHRETFHGELVRREYEIL